MKVSAAPIIDLIEVKMCEIEKLIEQKKLIKNHHNTNSSTISIDQIEKDQNLIENDKISQKKMIFEPSHGGWVG